MSGLEGEVERRVALGDLLGAAALLSTAGEHGRAAKLFERACAFAAAAEAAARAEHWGEAVRLAVLSGDADLIDDVSRGLVEHEPRDRVMRAALDLTARGEHRHAAPLLEQIDDFEGAAAAYARAGRVPAAARVYDRGGQPAAAARVLEAALRAGGDAEPDALRAQLGELYARHGKHQAAVRVLQQIPEASDQRAGVLGILATGLEALGLHQARRDLSEELARHRVATTPSERGREGAPPGAEAVLFGRYRVIREVASTPHARLIEGIDQLNGERVALKVLAARARGTGRDALTRFVREARALQQLRHPNVVPLRAFVPDGPAMVLAWMGGGSLRALLDREVVSPARAAEVARAVLDALGEAHRLGILHRDIKPSNLLFDEGGAARLADFGAAHMADAHATVTVGAIGTVAYMAPEQRAGRAASVESDLFGVGVLLYEMLSGELPGSSRPVSVQAFHPDLEAAHDAVLNRFLAEAPADRFSDALSARRAVESVSWATRLAQRTVARATPGAVPAGAVVASSRAVPPLRGGDRHDVWLARDVYVLPLDKHLERGACFARANHPALATILRADPEARELWVEVVGGRPLSQGLCLDDGQVEELRAALAALHGAGGVHGAVDGDHVYVHAGHARLAFPRSSSGGSEEGDRHALAQLPRA